MTGTDMNTQTHLSISASQKGFTLVELMVALAIGLFLIAGAFSVFVNGLRSQRTVDDQVVMIDNARFALETIAADIRQSGVFGRIKDRGKLNTPTLPAIGGECAAGWVANNTNIPPVQIYDNTNPYPATCTADMYASTPGSDVIEMRYSLLASVADANLLSDVVYVQSDTDQAQLFYGNNPPIPELLGTDAQGLDHNYMYVTNLYYVAANGDAGDGMPALHRVSLQPGGAVDQVLLSGVENMQIQLGLDSDKDGLVDQYIDSTAAGVTDWKLLKSVQVWLVVRALNGDSTLNTVVNTTIAGVPVTLPANGVNDGIRRMVVSTVATIRNTP